MAYARVERMIEEVCCEIHADIDDRHPDDVRLDEWIVAREDGIDHQFAYAIPDENGLDDSGAAEQ